jgi:hypothetical protein
VPVEAVVCIESYTTENQRTAGDESMDVIAMSDAEVHVKISN